jgi:hypothetical protein
MYSVQFSLKLQNNFELFTSQKPTHAKTVKNVFASIMFWEL